MGPLAAGRIPRGAQSAVNRPLPAAALIAVACLAAEPLLAQCALDDEQSVYDGGTSARTLPGYTVWQSFTPSTSGTLCRIDMGFFNDMSGFGELQVLEGEGTAGALLSSQRVPVVAFSVPGVSWNSWDVDVPVSAGLRYTFNFIPDAATLPDPYGVAIGAGNPYPDGVMGLDDPSGSYPLGFDVCFRTFLGEDGLDVYRAATPLDLATAPNVIATVADLPHDDAAPPAARVLYYEVEAGASEVIGLARLAGGGVRLSWR